MKNLIQLTTFLSILVIFACSDDIDSSTGVLEDFSPILHNLATNVILATYEDLKVKANELKTASFLLEQDPTESNLIAVRLRWVEARSPWEQSEGFLFGPVDEEGLDPSLDSWPVNLTDLNNVLTSTNTLTTEFLLAQEGTLKGFHTIEYLLWGQDGNKQIEDFNTREFEYLMAAAGALAKDAGTLANLWLPTGGNYIEYIVTAGDNNLFPSQKSVLEQMVDALVIIADEVGNGKINDPFTTQDLSLEESRFSANSKADFADNIRSIKNIYSGYYSNLGNGQGISMIIRSKDPELDDQLSAQLDQTILALETLPGTFSEAIFLNKEEVRQVQSQIREIQNILEQNISFNISEL